MSTNVKKEKTGFFKGVKSELKKVSWPGKKDVINYTIVVLIMVLFCAIAIGAMDFVFKALFRFIS